MSSLAESRTLYLGVDCSTQSLKLTVVTLQRHLLTQVAVNYDADFGNQFGIKDGVVRGSYGEDLPASADTITTPSLLFVAALELALERLKATGVRMDRIRCVSASGQQHGSVYWKKGAEKLLSTLPSSSSPDSSFASHLSTAFSIANGPIWMDSSTGDECRALEEALGGPDAVAQRTGSRAYERFTGNQIAKIVRVLPQEYGDTERISLVSSMIPTLFLGRYASIDASDAAGMNLMDINAQGLPFEWDPACLDVAVKSGAAGGVEELERKLGPIVDSTALLGTVCAAFCERFGFSPTCEVVAGSGDNPCSLVGMQLTRVGHIGVSLGTSDTLFAVVPTSSCHPNGSFGHIFPNPTDTLHTRMAMICVKNGSLAREAVREMVDERTTEADASTAASAAAASSSSSSSPWSSFNSHLRSCPLGAHSRSLFAYPESEITPRTERAGWSVLAAGGTAGEGKEIVVAKDRQEFEALRKTGKINLTDAELARGVIESQLLNLRLHSLRLGLQQPKRLVVTGGASVNEAIVQTLADVFGCPVEGQSVVDDRTQAVLGRVSDTASLGAAFRALYSHELRHAYELSAEAAGSPMPEEEDGALQSPSGMASPLSPPSSQLQPRHIVTGVLAKPNDEAHRAYTDMLEEYERKQQIVVDALNQPKEPAQ